MGSIRVPPAGPPAACPGGRVRLLDGEDRVRPWPLAGLPRRRPLRPPRGRDRGGPGRVAPRGADTGHRFLCSAPRCAPPPLARGLLDGARGEPHRRHLRRARPGRAGRSRPPHPPAPPGAGWPRRRPPESGDLVAAEPRGRAGLLRGSGGSLRNARDPLRPGQPRSHPVRVLSVDRLSAAADRAADPPGSDRGGARRRDRPRSGGAAALDLLAQPRPFTARVRDRLWRRLLSAVRHRGAAAPLVHLHRGPGVCALSRRSGDRGIRGQAGAPRRRALMAPARSLRGPGASHRHQLTGVPRLSGLANRGTARGKVHRGAGTDRGEPAVGGSPGHRQPPQLL